MKRALLVGFCLLALAAGNAQSKNSYPLGVGSSGPRVCAAQWLLGANRPSVYRDKYFRVRVAKPACYYGQRTARQVELLRYRLGQPKPIPATFDRNLYLIVTGAKKRPARWVLLATARRTSGSVTFRAYPTSPPRRSWIGYPFGGTHSLGNYQSDNAVDIPCVPGTPIFAPIKGRLFGGYGPLGLSGSRYLGVRMNMVGLYRSRTVAFYMAHMRTLVVPPFALVEAGQKVGTCGQANGVYHLHIGASYGFPIVSFFTGRY